MEHPRSKQNYRLLKSMNNWRPQALAVSLGLLGSDWMMQLLRNRRRQSFYQPDSAERTEFQGLRDLSLGEELYFGCCPQSCNKVAVIHTCCCLSLFCHCICGLQGAKEVSCTGSWISGGTRFLVLGL